MLGIALKAGKELGAAGVNTMRHPLHTGAKWAGAGLAGTLGVGMTASLWSAQVEATAMPDLGSGMSEVHYNIVSFKPSDVLTFGVGKTAVTATVEGLNTTYKTKLPALPDPSISCKLNREMTGVAQSVYGLPLKGLSVMQGPDGATNNIVNPSDFRLFNGWGEDSGFGYRDYTLDKGRKNFDDTAGFCRSVVRYESAATSLLRVNGWENAFAKADSIVNKAMSAAALRKLDEGACTPANVNELAIKAVEDAFTKLASAQPNTKLGVVTLAKDENGKPLRPAFSPFVGKAVTEQVPTSALGSETSNVQWRVDNPADKLDWDNMTCTAEQAGEINQTLTEATK